jgi:hypothetical protein
VPFPTLEEMAAAQQAEEAKAAQRRRAAAAKGRAEAAAEEDADAAARAPPLGLALLRRWGQHAPGWAAGALRVLSWQSTARQSSIRGGVAVELPLAHPTRPGAAAGRLRLRVGYRPSALPGAPRMRGPVRFRQNLCAVAGLLLGKGGRDEEVRHGAGGRRGRQAAGGGADDLPWATDALRRRAAPCAGFHHRPRLPTVALAPLNAACPSPAPQITHSTFKLFLHEITRPDAFGAARCPWNRGHPAAAAIFNHPLALQVGRKRG